MNARKAAVVVATMAAAVVTGAGVLTTGLNALAVPPTLAPAAASSFHHHAEFATVGQLPVDGFLTLDEDLALSLDDTVPAASREAVQVTEAARRARSV